MAYKVQFKKSAYKELKKLDKTSYKRIREAIDKLGQNPRPGSSTKLVGSSSLWRLKVGAYRVIYDIQDKKLVVIIIKVGNRKDIYR